MQRALDQVESLQRALNLAESLDIAEYLSLFSISLSLALSFFLC